MFSPPIELNLGEAFIHRDFDIEGDFYSAISLMDSISTRTLSPGDIAGLARDILALPKSSLGYPAGYGPARLSGAQHSLERDRVAIQYHYDVGNDFYSLWLDRRMQYSCIAHLRSRTYPLALAHSGKDHSAL
jgi:cyclopropane-fatty-acyl-phospholipid synthase